MSKKRKQSRNRMSTAEKLMLYAVIIDTISLAKDIIFKILELAFK